MKKVLILSNSINGLHNFRKEVIKTIKDSGYEVIISVPDEDERSQYFEAIGCTIIKTIFNRRGMSPLADLKLMFQYCSLIRSIKPSVALTYTIKPNIYGGMACCLTNTPQLANITGLGDAVENGGWLQKLSIVLYRIGLSKAKSVFFQNAYNRDFCIKHKIADNNTILLPGSGVNLSHHKYQDYPADNGNVRFLFIGRLLKDKGIEEYFEASKRICEAYPNVEFQILGRIDGDYKDKLDSFVHEGIIKHLGTTTDVRPYIGAVHCTIMPSYHEGMSNVNLESSANGRPVITTNVSGCKETVDDGITGYLVRPKSVECLFDAIVKFLELPYCEKKQMGQNARKKVENEFDRQIVVDAYLKAVRECTTIF